MLMEVDSRDVLEGEEERAVSGFMVLRKTVMGKEILGGDGVWNDLYIHGKHLSRFFRG